MMNDENNKDEIEEKELIKLKEKIKIKVEEFELMKVTSKIRRMTDRDLMFDLHAENFKEVSKNTFRVQKLQRDLNSIKEKLKIAIDLLLNQEKKNCENNDKSKGKSSNKNINNDSNKNTNNVKKQTVLIKPISRNIKINEGSKSGKNKTIVVNLLKKKRNCKSKTNNEFNDKYLVSKNTNSVNSLMHKLKRKNFINDTDSLLNDPKNNNCDVNDLDKFDNTRTVKKKNIKYDKSPNNAITIDESKISNFSEYKELIQNTVKEVIVKSDILEGNELEKILEDLN